MDGLGRILLPVSLVAAVALPLYFIAAALGVRFGVWGIRTGLLDMIILNGAWVILGVLALGALALVVAFLAQPRTGVGLAAVAFLVPLIGFIGTTQYTNMRYPFPVPKLVSMPSYPPIHDVSTDLTDPPTFTSAIMELRGEESNPVLPPDTVFPDSERMVAMGLAGKTRGEVQTEAFPDIMPVHLAGLDPAAAFDASVGAAKKIGVKFVNQDKDSGIIEGTVTTFWYGFKDDVVVRVRPAPSGEGSIVDARSISRIGGGDMGANGKRIRKFIEAMENSE